MIEQDVKTILADYRVKVDIISALGFILANKEDSVTLFGQEFYDTCEHAFRDCNID